jgi:hypothetical protein
VSQGRTDKIADSLLCNSHIQVVWDSKINRHNSALWAPSFILSDFAYLEEMVVRWLSQPVGDHLKAGSPDKDYTLEAASFIKSWQVDIDARQQFHNS